VAPRLRLSPWVGLSALLALGALCAWPLPRDLLDWQGTEGWPWRAFSAAWVHWTPRHLAANLLGCAVLAGLGNAARLPARSSWAWLAAWPLTQIGLLLRPELHAYGGLSGVLHAGVAVAAVELLFRGGRERLIGAALLAGLLVKIAGENPLGPALQQVPGWDMPVSPFAHLTGAASGALAAFAIIAATFRQPAVPDGNPHDDDHRP
jgi:rhomboid family GlyGly-CTERM serine protease